MIMEAALHSRVANHYAYGDLVGAIRDGLGRIGCGLGGPARQIAAHYGCQVDGIDPTRDYVEACNVLSEWLHLNECVSCSTATLWPYPSQIASFLPRTCCMSE